MKQTIEKVVGNKEEIWLTCFTTSSNKIPYYDFSRVTIPYNSLTDLNSWQSGGTFPMTVDGWTMYPTGTKKCVVVTMIAKPWILNFNLNTLIFYNMQMMCACCSATFALPPLPPHLCFDFFVKK